MRSAQASLSVEVHPDERDPSTVRLRLDGELDITSSPLLQTVVEQVLQARREPACARLVVDMSGVGFADASGISPLLLGRAMLNRRGGHIELRHCRRSVLRLLRLLDLAELADLADLEDAG